METGTRLGSQGTEAGSWICPPGRAFPAGFSWDSRPLGLGVRDGWLGLALGPDPCFSP